MELHCPERIGELLVDVHNTVPTASGVSEELRVVVNGAVSKCLEYVGPTCLFPSVDARGSGSVVGLRVPQKWQCGDGALSGAFKEGIWARCTPASAWRLLKQVGEVDCSVEQPTPTTQSEPLLGLVFGLVFLIVIAVPVMRWCNMGHVRSLFSKNKDVSEDVSSDNSETGDTVGSMPSLFQDPDALIHEELNSLPKMTPRTFDLAEKRGAAPVGGPAYLGTHYHVDADGKRVYGREE